MKVGITGSRNYENKRKIKEFIFKLKNIHKDLLIVSAGSKLGADKYTKKYALELECNYLEFNPAHTQKNLYSGLQESYYDKPYNVKNFFSRNKMLARYCDVVVLFIPEGDTATNTSTHIISEAKKYKKKVVIIS